MYPDEEFLRQCVATESRTHGWGLTPQEEQDYVIGLRVHIPQRCSDMLLRQIVWCYHHDHKLVAALLDGASLEGQEHWLRCVNQMPALLRYAQLRWDIDSSADQEDLCQIGAMTVFQALSQFHYHSRFSTWMFQVFRNSVLRALRDRKAGKRYGPTDSYDEQPALMTKINDQEGLESTMQFNALMELINEVLAKAPDQRLQHIFMLWARDDLRLADIGRITKLSLSRVSILLEQARALLRQHPDIQAWVDRLPADGSAEPASSHKQEGSD